MPWTPTDRSFKTLIFRRTTDSTGKYYYNEKGDWTLNVHVEDIWADSIDSSPAAAVTAGIAVAYTKLLLTEDLSVPGKQAFFATTNSDVNAAQTDEASRLKDWIPDRYGSGYFARLFDNAGNEVFPTDSSGWFFDSPTGILTFDAANTDNGSVISRAPYHITAWRYIGIKGAGGGGGTIGGSGTGGYVAQWEGSGATTTLGNSILENTASGVITVNGTLEATGSKNFAIKHPTRPGYQLVYGCLEGPENGVYYRGTIRGSGCCRVELPDYWADLVWPGYSIQLTARGPFGLYIAAQDECGFSVRRLGILGWIPGIPFEFDFFVCGERIDAPLTVERPVRR